MEQLDNDENRTDKRIAVLIDADNVSDKYVSLILDEISVYGTPTYKRIYADWTVGHSGWKNVLLQYSITPIQQYNYTTGKNATDFALVIDAMDILYSGNVDGFCIVSSDSDFTRLAARLREAGMFVCGMGEQKTPKPFIAACNEFKFLDLLADNASLENASQEAPEEKDKSSSITPLKDITRAIKSIIDTSDEEDGVDLGTIGNMLRKRYSDFDSRNYGFSRLLLLIKSRSQFKIKKEGRNIKVSLADKASSGKGGA